MTATFAAQPFAGSTGFARSSTRLCGSRPTISSLTKGRTGSPGADLRSDNQPGASGCLAGPADNACAALNGAHAFIQPFALLLVSLSPVPIAGALDLSREPRARDSARAGVPGRRRHHQHDHGPADAGNSRAPRSGHPDPHLPELLARDRNRGVLAVASFRAARREAGGGALACARAGSPADRNLWEGSICGQQPPPPSRDRRRLSDQKWVSAGPGLHR